MAGGGEQTPIGTIIPYGKKDDIPDGYLLCNGAEVSKVEYEDLYNAIGDTYGEATDSTCFVLPDLRDKTIWGGEIVDIGEVLEPGLPNISFATNRGKYQVNDYTTYDTTNDALVIGKDIDATNFAFGGIACNNIAITCGSKFDASKANPIYSDNINTVQPPAVVVVFLIKAYNTVSSTSVGDLINLDDTNIKVTYKDTFTYIYPNGGSEDSPANVTTSSRYVEDNPFPGYIVNTQVEVYFNNQWGDPGWNTHYYNSVHYAIGVRSSQLNNDTIIVQTGYHPSNLTLIAQYSGSSFGNISSGTTLPCRLKVWKVGKVDNSTPDLQEVSVNNIITVDEDQYMKNNFVVLYPNNGTKESPANITTNTRLIENNPFPGYYVHCVAELFYNNQWGDPGWYTDDFNSGRSVGVRAKFNSTNDVITIQSGTTAILDRAVLTGSAFERVDSNIFTAPVRVIVWKVGKLPE